MKFSVTPYPGDSGFAQWHDAMKMVARLPGGIPPEFRKRLWLTLAEKHLQARNVDWSQVERFCFNEWSNPDDDELGVQIVKDLHRTGCSLFCGAEAEENQALLKRVLLAYARWNKAVGYCQGFNMLAALILQVMDRSESDSVKVMIYLIEGVLPESYFANNLRGLSVDMAVFRDLLRLRLPSLSRHLEQLQHEAGDSATGTSYEPPLTNVFTMQWFLTLFSNCLPQVTVLRVWDLIFLEGNEVLLRTALAIWDVLADRIMAVTSADEFYSIMGVLTREMLEFGLMDTNKLVKTIVTIAPFPFPELPDLRDKYLYNITPWTQQVSTAARKGLRLFYSDDDEETDEDDEKIAVAAAYGITSVFRSPRRKDSITRAPSPTTSLSTVGYSMYPSDRERITLDISALKHQYAKLRERQRQAHIILTAACARQPLGPSAPTPVAMNHLLLGKSALLSVRGKRGPPQGAIPPPALRAAPKAHRGKPSSLPTKGQTLSASRIVKPQKQKEEKESGETLYWKDTGSTKKLRRGSRDVQIEDDTVFSVTDPDKVIPLITTSDMSDMGSKDVNRRHSENEHSGMEEINVNEAAAEEENDNSSDSSSTSTELCDEPDRLSDFDSEEPTSVSDVSSYLAPSDNVLTIPAATTDSSATTPDLLSPSSAVRDYSAKSSSADNSEDFASSETTSSATTPSPMAENKSQDDWSSKEDVKDLSLSVADNTVQYRMDVSNDSSTLHVSSDEKSFTFSDHTLRYQPTPVSADTSIALNISDTEFASPEQSIHEKQRNLDLIPNSPDCLQSIGELSQCLEKRTNGDQISESLAENKSLLLSPLIEEYSANKAPDLVIINSQTESVTEETRTVPMKNTFREERLDDLCDSPNTKDMSDKEYLWRNVKNSENHECYLEDPGVTFYENDINNSHDNEFVSETNTLVLHNHKLSVDNESSILLLTQSSPETEVNKIEQNDEVSIISTTAKESDINLGLTVDYSEMAEILETAQSIDLGRRNSERALKIIQENSQILQRILQCHARKVKSSEVGDGTTVALDGECQSFEDKFSITDGEGFTCNVDKRGLVCHSAEVKDDECVELSSVSKKSAMSPSYMTNITQTLPEKEFHKSCPLDTEKTVNLETLIMNNVPIISADSCISQSVMEGSSSLPLKATNKLYSQEKEEGNDSQICTSKNEDNIENESFMQNVKTEKDMSANEVLKSDTIPKCLRLRTETDHLDELLLNKSDTSLSEKEILYKTTVSEKPFSTNVDSLRTSAESEFECFYKDKINKYELPTEPNTSTKTPASERSYFSSENDSSYGTPVIDSEFSLTERESFRRREITEGEFSKEHRCLRTAVFEFDLSSVNIETKPKKEYSEHDYSTTEIDTIGKKVLESDSSSKNLGTIHKTEAPGNVSLFDEHSNLCITANEFEYTPTKIDTSSAVRKTFQESESSYKRLDTTRKEDIPENNFSSSEISQSRRVQVDSDHSLTKSDSARKTKAPEHDDSFTEITPLHIKTVESESWFRKSGTSFKVAGNEHDYNLLTEHEASDIKTTHDHFYSQENRLDPDSSSCRIDSNKLSKHLMSMNVSTNVDPTCRSDMTNFLTEVSSSRKNEMLDSDSNISSFHKRTMPEPDTSSVEYPVGRDRKSDSLYASPDTSHEIVPEHNSSSFKSYKLQTEARDDYSSFSVEPKSLSRATVDKNDSFPTDDYSPRRKIEDKHINLNTSYEGSENLAQSYFRLSKYVDRDKKSLEYSSAEHSVSSETDNSSQRKYPSYLSARRYDERRSTIHTCDKVDRNVIKSFNIDFSEPSEYSKARASNKLESYSIKGSSGDLESGSYKYKSYSDITSPLSTEAIPFSKTATGSELTYNKSSTFGKEFPKEGKNEEESHISGTADYRRKTTDYSDISYSSPSRRTTLSIDNTYPSNKRWSTGTWYSDIRPTCSSEFTYQNVDDSRDLLHKTDTTKLSKYSPKHTSESLSSTSTFSSESVYKSPSRSRSKSPLSSPSRTRYTCSDTSTSAKCSEITFSESRERDSYTSKYSSKTYRTDNETDDVLSKSQVSKVSPTSSPTKKDFRSSLPPIKSPTSTSSSQAMSKYDPFPSRSSQRQPKELGVKLGLYSSTTSKSKYSSKKYDDK